MSSSSDQIAIQCVGAHTSLGAATQAAAAFCCGMTRAEELTEWPYFDEDTLHEQRIIGHPACGLGGGFQGLGRLLKMSVFAIRDLFASDRLSDIDETKVGMIIVFPSVENGEALMADPTAEFDTYFEKLSRMAGLRLERPNCHSIADGRLSLVAAFRHARELLQSKQLDTCIVGAVDTLLDGQRLYGLIRDDRINTVDRPTGLVPGEAACFVALVRIGKDSQEGLTICEPAYASNAEEQESHDNNETEGDDNPSPGEQNNDDEDGPTPDGAVLAEAVQQALRQGGVLPDAKGTIYADLNGEEWRAADFGNALIRLAPDYDLREWRVEIPALSFGDTGAASGLLSICLAAKAAERGYLTGETCLVNVSSDLRHSGAIILGRLRHG